MIISVKSAVYILYRFEDVGNWEDSTVILLNLFYMSSMKLELYWLVAALVCSLMRSAGGVVKLMSFNTGLTSRIPYRPERSQYIAGHLAQSQPDYICLQEVNVVV